MIIPIKCFNCGQILASKYKRYQRLLNASKLIKLDTSKGFRLYLPSELDKDTWEPTDEITKETHAITYSGSSGIPLLSAPRAFSR